MVVIGDLVIPGSPKISGVSSKLTTPAPLCSSDKQPLNNRQSVEASCAPRKPPDDLCTTRTQSSEIPVSKKPVSLPMVTKGVGPLPVDTTDGPTGSANNSYNTGHYSYPPVTGEGTGRQLLPQTSNKNRKQKSKKQKKGRRLKAC